MTITDEPAPATTEMPRTRSLALDLTRACQAACDHCYNHSGPGKTTGAMTREDWLSVLDQAAAMGARRVQFIGGEPTLHPDLPKLINHAVDSGLAVEIFSNLIHIRPHLWPVLRQRGVALATSYYSDHADEHDQITHHRGSYQRTKANITKALAFRIPLRAALVQVRNDQRVVQAEAELRELGVTHIRTDHVRSIGRGAGATDLHDVNELCGNCTRGRAAVMPDGSVAGCVMSGGMMTAGNVRTQPLTSIIGSTAWHEIAAQIPQRNANRQNGCTPDEDSCQPSPGTDPLHDLPVSDACTPDSCTPKEDSCQPSPSADPWAGITTTACNPDQDGSDCAPAESEACEPSY